MPSERVLVTGAAGGVGRAVCRQLVASGHEVTAFDRRPSPHGSHILIGELMDREAVNAAARDQEAIVHLAATPDEADFLAELIEPNVRGLFHVCDAARAQGVQRLVLASSVQVVSGHSFREVIHVEDGPRVINHYALTKLWLEQMGDLYARVYGLSVIAVRLGWLPRAPAVMAEIPASATGTDIFLSHNDAGRFFTAAVEAELAEGQFEIVFATSRPERQQRLDLEPARQLLGYEPQDRWPDGVAFDDLPEG